MPVTTEKHIPTAKRGTALAIVGGVLFVLLSLPAVLTLFPKGVSVGAHGVSASWESYAFGADKRFWVLTGTGQRYHVPARSFVVGWGPRCYMLLGW